MIPVFLSAKGSSIDLKETENDLNRGRFFYGRGFVFDKTNLTYNIVAIPCISLVSGVYYVVLPTDRSVGLRCPLTADTPQTLFDLILRIPLWIAQTHLSKCLRSLSRNRTPLTAFADG